MNMKQFGILSLALVGAVSAEAAGFALYGGSAKGMAMGGAVMGNAIDASANYYNPATITDFDNTVWTVGMGTETPFANVAARTGGHKYTTEMNPGTFLLPHAYVVQPLPYDFSFGLGIAPEYGLGSAYSESWPMNWNTTETTIQGLVVNPNLAYKVTDDWSVAAGFRILYFSFEQRSRPQVPGIAINQGMTAQGINPYPNPMLGPCPPTAMYGLKNHIKADNGFSDYGYQVSTRYKILENLSAGVMYRSSIHTRVRGTSTTTAGNVPYVGNTLAGQNSGRGGANITLPQSVTAGLNWDATETLHFGYAMTWTHWSTMDKIVFNLPGGDKTVKLGWKDTFRFAFGGAWDFAEDWTLMGAYVFDLDPCSKRENYGSTMLPPGNRHNGQLGLTYRINKNWELTGTYGLILMKGRSQKFTDVTNREYRFSTSGGRSHQCGLTLSYYF